MLKLTVVALAATAMLLPPPASAKEALGAAQVVAKRDADGLIVRFTLPAPRTRVVFSEHGTIRDRWSVITPGLSLADGTISSSAPFEAFELRVLPDAAEVDRIYMGLTEAGEGRVVHGPSLKIEGLNASLSFDLSSGEAFLPGDNPIDGYAWIGPETDVKAEAHGDLVTGGNVAPELAASLRTTFAESMRFYETHLGANGFRPALIGSVDSPGPAMFRGDVTDTGVISVRFHGDAWRHELPTVVPFVWHETFHLWNGHGVENRDSENAPWLHEGGADYAAIVGAVSADALSESVGLSRLAEGLNGCRRVLGARDYEPSRLQSGNGPYACGLLIQWIADLEARRAGTGNVFTIWKTLITAGRANVDGYGVREFRALLEADSAVAALLDGPGADRWPSIRTRLTNLGVELGNNPGDADLRAAALFHVARQNCGGSYGFFDNPDGLKLDGNDCGPLSGEPVIDAIEGHDPQRDSRAMFDAVQARCAANQVIRYAARDGRTLEATCSKPLLEPQVWAVVSAPPLRLKP